MSDGEQVQSFAEDVAAVGRIAIIPTILDVVCRTTRMRFAAVARVTESRWIACSVRDEIAFGLVPGSELRLETTICDEIRQHGEAVVIDDVPADARYCGHHTPAMYGFRSYISMPIRLPDGAFFGTLCAIDPLPARLDAPEVRGMFTAFAELIALHLDAQRRLDVSEASLQGERRTAELREQFIAVLGHDLRNPLAAIQSGVSVLRMMRGDMDRGRVLGVMQRSVERMGGLIDNVLDLARGRLGGGLDLELGAVPLRPLLEQTIEELRGAWPGRTVLVDIELPRPVVCDRVRIGQLASNLIANALTHGDHAAPVTVTARIVGEVLELAVANAGEPIPAATLGRLFEPFFRGAVRSSQQGLGLGLYIASEIARAHGGTLTVVSTPAETRFTLRMPVDGLDAAGR
jgi:signal transduction histidine kinase